MIKKWGSYKVLASGKDYKVKLLLVKPHSATSLQTHNYRKELWFCLDQDWVEIIDMKEKHRLENTTNKPIRIIEVQLGKCLERDIKRYKEKNGTDKVNKKI